MSSGPVLLVEDDVDLREVMQEALALKGIHIDIAGNGVEALAYLRKSAKPALILLDLMMPIMDGAAFRQAQLAEPSFRDIPVVILSADRDLANKAKAMEASGFVRKPADVFELIELINRYTQSL